MKIMSDVRRRLIHSRQSRADDQWIAVHPISPAEVRELHMDAEKRMDDILAGGGYSWEPRPTFTCANCTIHDTCLLAFDEYNINGDCLLEK